MSQGNTVTVVGNVTREPELRFTPSGVAVASFGLAWNDRRFNKATQEYDEKVSYFDVTVWNEQAENVAESLPKGARVVVTGRVEQSTWETAEGDKRSKIEIQADEIGPSLRWATAKVTKNDRERIVSGQPTTATRPTAPAPAYQADEEPF